MAEVRWIKIDVDLFQNRKIQYLRSLPRGNELVLLWVMLLTLAGRCNRDGALMLAEGVPYTPVSLAREFGLPKSHVVRGLEAFRELGMIAQEQGTLVIPAWVVHQNSDQLGRIREQGRARVAAFRERHRQSCNVTGNVTCNGNQCVTNALRNATEEEKEKEKESEKRERETAAAAVRVIGALNASAGTRYLPDTPETVALIAARMAEGFSVEDMLCVIERKCREWRGTRFAPFLRPQTLFGPKFEGYLAAPPAGDGQGGDQGGGPRGGSFDTEAFFDAAIRKSMGGDAL